MSAAQRYGEIADGLDTRTAHDTQREAERIGRLVLALSDRGYDFSLRGYSNYATVHVYGSRIAGVAQRGIRTRSDAGSFAEALDLAIDRIDRED